MPFGGETYDRKLDRERLQAQLQAVKKVLLSASRDYWFTLEEISQRVDAPEASISARLRDLRKKKFGGYTVERKRVPGGNGLHIYRLVLPDEQMGLELRLRSRNGPRA